MSVWVLVQIALNLAFFVGLLTAWMRLKRPPQDDPRLSRGLQLLQTKIIVLEDLSDRTDAQVKQLTSLLDQKSRLLQNKLLEAEQLILKIDHSMNKSLEVAEIFQDKIPHEEVLERRQKVEYVRAARLAHSGLSVDDIAAQVALPREQLELIAKFNRERLMFDEDRLPEWASRPGPRDADAFTSTDRDLDLGADAFKISGLQQGLDFLGTTDDVPHDLADVARVDREFKAAVASAKQQDELNTRMLKDTLVVDSIKAAGAVMSMKARAQTLKDKLVATAEDMLRQQQQTYGSANHAAYPAWDPANDQAGPSSLSAPRVDAAAAAAPSTRPAPTPGSTSTSSPELDSNLSPMAVAQVNSVMQSQPTVRKVVFPRIEAP